MFMIVIQLTPTRAQFQEDSGVKKLLGVEHPQPSSPSKSDTGKHKFRGLPQTPCVLRGR